MSISRHVITLAPTPTTTRTVRGQVAPPGVIEARTRPPLTPLNVIVPTPRKKNERRDEVCRWSIVFVGSSAAVGLYGEKVYSARVSIAL